MQQENFVKRPFVVGFVGRSGSGKTTYAEAVVRLLSARGWRVGALKNAHHGFDMDKPGKDSWRYREAGAQAVLVRSDRRWALLTEAPEAPTVEALLEHFKNFDIVVVEGFKHEGAFPKIEVRRQAASAEPPLASDIAALAAVATDFEEAAFPKRLPRLDLNRPAEAADFIEALMKGAFASNSNSTTSS